MLEEFLAGTFGHHDHGVTPAGHALFQCRQEAFGTIEIKIDFGYQHKIGILLGKGGRCCDKA